jgi:hypothetical protein
LSLRQASLLYAAYLTVHFTLYLPPIKLSVAATFSFSPFNLLPADVFVAAVASFVCNTLRISRIYLAPAIAWMLSVSNDTLIA